MRDVAEFLAELPPFSGLPLSELEAVAAVARRVEFGRGEVLLAAGDGVARDLHVVETGRVEVLDGEVVVDSLTAGDVFGALSVFAQRPPDNDFRAADATTCLLIDGPAARRAFVGEGGLRFLTLALRHRLRRATDRVASPASTVGQVARGPLVVVDGSETIAEVARRLTDAGTTAAIVKEGGGLGIVTDRDMRARVVAENRSGSDPVSVVTSMPLRTVDAEELADTASVEMLASGIHHLPVVRGGEVVGMLTDLDLLGRQRREPFVVRSRILRAGDVDEVRTAAEAIPDCIARLVEAGVDPDHTGAVMATLADAIVVRLLALAEEIHGDAPGAYSWLALGSAGRREQALATDQDHALVYADGLETEDDWFLAVARFVVDGLARCGFPRCESKVMASEDGWRGSESWWRDRIAGWMRVREPKPAFLTALVFDGRPVVGDLVVDPLLGEAVHAAQAAPGFRNELARLVTGIPVPVGMFGRVLLDDGTQNGYVDVKRGGVLPITELARIHALAAGLGDRGTVARLEGSARSGVLDTGMAEALVEAFGVLRDVRIRHQVDRFRSGSPPDDLVNPDALAAIQRRSLRDALRVVREGQREMAERLRPRVLGR